MSQQICVYENGEIQMFENEETPTGFSSSFVGAKLLFEENGWRIFLWNSGLFAEKIQDNPLLKKPPAIPKIMEALKKIESKK